MSIFEVFMNAVREGNVLEVKRLFLNEYINKKYDGCTALHYTCLFNDDEDVVKYLLDEKFNIEEEETYYRQRPIHLAAASGNVAVMKTLIERGCSLNVFDKNKKTPLDLAIAKKKEECIKILKFEMFIELLKKKKLSKIIDNRTRKTLLDKLLDNKDQRIIEAIKSKPIDDNEIQEFKSINLRKIDPESYILLNECMLLRSMLHKYDDGVYMLSSPEIINKDSLFMGPSALETAVELGTVFWVKHILKMFVAENESWEKAEKIAKIKNKTMILSLLEERRTYLCQRREEGYSRLHVAVMDNDPIVVEYIVKNRIVNVDEVCKKVGTALSMSYDMGHMECVKILQNKKANANILDKFNQSPLNVAINNRLEGQCQYLLDNISNIDNEDFMGFTVLERSVMNDCMYICERLLKNGSRCDRYVKINTQLFDIDKSLGMILYKTPHLALTSLETIYSLCFKVNKTIYPCLLAKINDETIDLTDEYGNTLLHLCATSLMWSICSQLILKSATVDIYNKNKNTPLLELLLQNSNKNWNEIGEDMVKTVDTLINGGASLYEKDSNENNVLDICTEYYNEKLLLVLINKGKPLNLITEAQLSAWLNKKFNVVIKEVIPLLNNGLPEQWLTHEHIKKSLECDDMLLTEVLYNGVTDDIKVNVVEIILYKASIMGNKELFIKMINDHVSENSCLDEGESLLNCLIRERKLEFIKIVMSSRNSSLFTEKKNRQQKLPLQVCIECGYWKVIYPLIADTKSVNNEDKDGHTPLSLLFMKMSETAETTLVDKLMTYVKLLITKSANIYKVNKLNKAVIKYCTKTDLKSIVKLFFQEHQSAHKLDVTIETNSLSSTNNEVERNSVFGLPLCMICEDEHIDCALNCGHMFCMTCANKDIYCYICRGRITDKRKVFL